MSSAPIYSKSILRELAILTRFIIGGCNLNSIKYVEDTDLMSDSKRKITDLQDMKREREEKVNHNFQEDRKYGH